MSTLLYTTHFKTNRAFKVIQGHPYWCLQKSRTDFCMWMAHLTYICCGFHSWQCVTEWSWALTVSHKNVTNELYSFWAKEFFLRIYAGLLHRRRWPEWGRENGNFSLNPAWFRRYCEMCGFLMTQRQMTLKDVWVPYIMLENFIGHVCGTLS